MNSSRVREVLNDYYSTDQLMPRIVKNFFITLYIGFSLLAIAVNLLIASIIIRKQSLRNRTNLLIVNLMVADLLLALICMPLTLMTFIRKSWPLGSILCQIVPVGQGLPVFASSLTIAVISIDRLLRATSIVPRQQNSSSPTLLIEVLFIWITSLLLSLPQGFSQKVIQVGIPGLYVYSKCIEDTTTIYLTNLYSILITSIQLLLPTISLSLSYFKIKRHLQTGLRRQSRHDTVPTILLGTTSFTSASEGDISRMEACISSNVTQEQPPTASKKVLQVSKNLKVCLKVSKELSSSLASVVHEDKPVAEQEKSVVDEEKTSSNEERSVNEKKTVVNEEKPSVNKTNRGVNGGNERSVPNERNVHNERSVPNERNVHNERSVPNEEKPSVKKPNGGVSGGNERSVLYELDHTLERRLRREMDRNKIVTNTLLIITASFIITWTPWNVISILVDFFPLIIVPNQYFLEILAVAHFLAMTSATLNPLLYGYWNPSIRKELIKSRQGTSV